MRDEGGDGRYFYASGESLCGALLSSFFHTNGRYFYVPANLSAALPENIIHTFHCSIPSDRRNNSLNWAVGQNFSSTHLETD